jgi:hypothetical protein
MLVFFKKEKSMTEQEARYSKWVSLIEEQEKSGMNQESFCEMKGISVAKLQYYRKKTRTSPARPRQKFSEVKLTSAIPKPTLLSKEIRLILQNGIQCFLPADIDIQRAKEWVEVLLSC